MPADSREPVRPADRGQPRRPAPEPLPHMGAAAGILRAVGRPRGRAGPRCVRRRQSRPHRPLRPCLHGAAAGRALPGRRRGPRRAVASTCRSRISSASARGGRAAGTPCRPGGARCARLRGRACARAAGRGAAADRRALGAGPAGGRCASSPGAARRWRRSSAPATTCSPARPAPAGRAGALALVRTTLAEARGASR